MNEKEIKEFYTKGNYIKKHPDIHEKDSPWKISKIKPFVDEYVLKTNKKEIILLDVGGGKGIILKEISDYLRERHNIKVNKYVLDLSAQMLDYQKKINPDILNIVEADICKAPFENKEIDLVLMIDVLEHLPNTEKALKELKRISKYVLFKVPLENNLFFNLINILRLGSHRQQAIKDVGHINSYNFRSLLAQLQQNLGKVIKYQFTNVYEYYASKNYPKKLPRWKYLRSKVGSLLFNISPQLSAKIFSDFLLVLVEAEE